jgi:ribosomal protein L16 Arg81 hydroxylase
MEETGDLKARPLPVQKRPCRGKPCYSKPMVDFGTTPQEFHRDLLEKTCYLHKAAQQDHPFTWSGIDALVHQIEPVEPFFQLFGEGPVPSDAYTQEVAMSGLRRRRLVKDRFTRLMTGGATLVINRMEMFSLEARRLCDEVERFAGYQTTANGYITFGGTGTFGKHWDTHDVFAFQLIGKKRWNVFPATFPHPLVGHTNAQIPHQCPVTPILDCTLETGDLLYIPRGWWHQTTPLDEPSFHLSVGLFVPTLIDYALWVCSRLLPQTPLARKGLLGPESMHDLAAAMQAAKSAALNPAHVAEFLKMLTDQRRQAAATETQLFSGLAARAASSAPR